MLPIHSSRHKERGQSLTELAISFMLMVLLVAGIAELGRAFFTFISLRDAAQEGALIGSIAPSDLAGIVDRTCGASNFIQGLSCSSSSGTSVQVEINLPGGEACMGYPIEVVVTYNNFPVLMPFVGIFTGDSISLSARVTDTILSPKCN
jgi:Flp pilus assembly protein TadG